MADTPPIATPDLPLAVSVNEFLVNGLLDSGIVDTGRAPISDILALLISAVIDQIGGSFASGAGIYPSTVTGLAAVAEGAYFYVDAPDDTVLLILYRKEGGVAVEKGRLSSEALVTALVNSVAANRNAAPHFLTITGTASALIGASTPAVTSYQPDQIYLFVAGASNTGPVTLAVSGLAAQPVTAPDGSELAASAIVMGRIHVLARLGAGFCVVFPVIGSASGDDLVALSAMLAKLRQLQSAQFSPLTGVVWTDEQGNGVLEATNRRFAAQQLRVEQVADRVGVETVDEAGVPFQRITRATVETPVSRQERIETDEVGVVWADEVGEAFHKITPDECRHWKLDEMRAELDRGGLTGGAASNWRMLAQLIHIIIYGQSLSRGSEGAPAISTAPLSYAKKFVGGVRAVDGPSGLWTDPANYASLSDLSEQNNGSLGETPSYGSAQMIAQLLQAENGITLGAEQLLLYATPGQGGRTIATLMDPSQEYLPRFNAQMSYGKARANDLGKTYAVGLGMVQGEANYNEGTPSGAWTRSMVRFRADAEAEARRVGKNDREVPMFLCQTCSHINYGRAVPNIAIAQLRLARKRAFVFVTTKYFFPYADPQHLTAAGYKHLGAYYGLAFKRAFFDGIKVRPLLPVQIERLDNTVYLLFDTPTVFDTTTIPADAAGTYGFRLADASGASIAVSNVTAQRDGKLIVIKSSASIPAGARLRYAWEGPGTPPGLVGVGNVRDKQGDTLILDPTGFNKPLHRWLPINEWTL